MNMENPVSAAARPLTATDWRLVERRRAEHSRAERRCAKLGAVLIPR